MLALALPCVLAACGAGSKQGRPAGNAVVKGIGFEFEAPPGWTARTIGRAVEARSDATSSTVVSATAFTLVKRYSPKLFARAATELDGIAAKLAVQSHSTLAESKTITVGGEKVRAYRLTVKPASGAPFDERIGFVLHGKREYQLLCRAPVGSGDPDGACALLYATFKLSA